MTIRIQSVLVSPLIATTGQAVFIAVRVSERSWQTIKDQYNDWDHVMTAYTNWNQARAEGGWSALSEDYASWNDVKNGFSNWNEVKAV